MAITSNIGQYQSSITPEARQMMNERKRVESYIRSYQRMPDNWSESMLNQLEIMAMQYQVPFKRQVPDAGALRNLGAMIGGALDSAAFGFIKDDWYSSEATRKAANVGKIGGAAAQIAAAALAAPFTGGGSIAAAGKGLTSAVSAAKGLSGAANIAKAAGKLGTTVASKGLPGRATTYAMQKGAETFAPYAAGKGFKFAQNVQKGLQRRDTANILKEAKAAIRNTGYLKSVVKCKSLNKDQIRQLTNTINAKYGEKSKVAADYIEQLASTKMVGNLEGVSTAQLVKMAQSTRKNWGVNANNVAKLLKQAGANDSPENVTFIVSKLRNKNIVKLDEKAVAEIIKMANNPTAKAMGLTDISKVGALQTAGAGFGALSSLTDYTPSREELEMQEDPYNPANR